MKYDLSCHSIYNEGYAYLESVVSLYIGTIEMVFDYASGNLICVQGFLPLVKAERREMNFPKYEDGIYQIPRYDGLELKEYMAYEFDSVCKESSRYFTPLKIRYDCQKGLIAIGNADVTEDIAIRVKSDTYCYCDDMNNLKGICVCIENTELPLQPTEDI